MIALHATVWSTTSSIVADQSSTVAAIAAAPGWTVDLLPTTRTLRTLPFLRDPYLRLPEDSDIIARGIVGLFDAMSSLRSGMYVVKSELEHLDEGVIGLLDKHNIVAHHVATHYR